MWVFGGLCLVERSFELSSELANIEVNSLSCSDVEQFLSLKDSQIHPVRNALDPSVEAKASPRSPSSVNGSGDTSGCFLPLQQSFLLNTETPSDPVLLSQNKPRARTDASDSCLSPRIPSQSRLLQSKRMGTPLSGNETKKSMVEQRPPSWARCK